MDANAQLTDQQRVELAGLEYQPLGVGDHVRLSNGKRIGRVKRVFYKGWSADNYRQPSSRP